MQVNNIQNKNTNFGMAIKISPKAGKILERDLTPKATQQLKALIEAEKSNPVDINIATELRYFNYGHSPFDYWAEYDEIVTKVNGKQFGISLLKSMFSTSNGIISSIKKGVEYAHKLTQKG